MIRHLLLMIIAMVFASTASAQMGHPPDIAADTARAAGAFSGDADLHFVYDKLIDSTTIMGAALFDAHSGSNFLMTAVTGHTRRPTVSVMPEVVGRFEAGAYVDTPALFGEDIAVFKEGVLCDDSVEIIPRSSKQRSFWRPSKATSRWRSSRRDLTCRPTRSRSGSSSWWRRPLRSLTRTPRRSALARPHSM